MSTGAIVVIVVAAIIVLALLAYALPRMRARQTEAARERELSRKRDQEVDRHRGEAEVRGVRAEQAEQRAQIAAKEAEVERARAEAHEARASMHERGLADEELTDDRDAEAERTPGQDRTAEDRFDRGDDPGTTGEREHTSAPSTTQPTTEYERGRRDEARDENR